MPLSSHPRPSDNRTMLLERISTTPGIGLSDLKQEIEMSNGTLQWHLDSLLRNRRIRTVLRGNRRQYFPAGLEPDPFEELSPLQAQLLEVVILRGSVGQSLLARILGVNPSTITRNVRHLKGGGWLKVETVSGKNVVSPGQNLLLQTPPS